MKILAIAALAALSCTGCTTHYHATDYHGIPGIRGEPVEYQQTSVWALHFLFVLPLIGNARVEKCVSKFTEEANDKGATRINIEATNTTTYWFILPPLTLFLHLVNTTVEGQVEGTSAKTGS